MAPARSHDASACRREGLCSGLPAFLPLAMCSPAADLSARAVRGQDPELAPAGHRRLARLRTQSQARHDLHPMRVQFDRARLDHVQQIGLLVSMGRAIGCNTILLLVGNGTADRLVVAAAEAGLDLLCLRDPLSKQRDSEQVGEIGSMSCWNSASEDTTGWRRDCSRCGRRGLWHHPPWPPSIATGQGPNSRSTGQGREYSTAARATRGSRSRLQKAPRRSDLKGAGTSGHGSIPRRHNPIREPVWQEWGRACGIHGRNECLQVKPCQVYGEILWNAVVEIAGAKWVGLLATRIFPGTARHMRGALVIARVRPKSDSCLEPAAWLRRCNRCKRLGRGC